MADAAPEHSSNRMKHRPSRATARAEEPRPFATEVARGSGHGDWLRDLRHLLTWSMHQIVKRDALWVGPGIFNPDPAPLLSRGDPGDGAPDHVTAVGSENPVPGEEANVEGQDRVRRRPRRTPPPPR